MNRYLLDTHILLWWLANDKKLVKKTRDLIANPSNNIIVSTVSIWEIVIKKSLNKLIAPDNLKEVIISNDFSILSITADHALYLEKLPMIHNDPFDRLLIAQSLVEKVTLITADEIIPKYDIKCL
ncbi:MAG: type II toxin-antitoxin system VapC family toxin [Candidatus Dependentiae bacterium]|nr:type II toxin-antitoxin system VapC family toxin [Candidatus Dependentiae bacterium]